MQNYHKHTCYSNVFIADSAALYEDYAKRAVELGHKILSSVEHGWQSNYYITYDVAKKYNLKFIFGAEAYWVKDRFEKDRTNCHIIILAKTEIGRRAINRILSDANESGYYFRPRVDIELLLSLPKNDVFITTACVGFWNYDDIDEIVLQLHSHFKDNFMLEIQYHHTEKQYNLNKKILELSNKYGIEMIVGMDSHYIYPEQEKERDYILAAKNIHYEDEDGWFMDYPDDEVTISRFLQQNIFSKEQIQKAMNNTNIILDFDDIEFNEDIKLPTLYPDKTLQEKNKIYTRLITKEFKEYMKDIPTEEYDRYYQGIKNEVEVIKNTGMADYFLIDNAIVNRAIEKGGIITDSGRGSGVGYFTNTLLGFSKVDRFTSPIKLYPERFISESRILETKSLPDLDLNCGNPEIFAEAQEEILGEGHAYPMIAFGTFKKKSAFKLYARAKNLDFDIATTISNQLEKYDEALKYAEDDERDEINIYDYVEEKYHDYITQSEPYWGVISDKKKAPCAFLIYGGNIKEEIGLIKCKSESTKKECITTVIDGAVAEKYKFLKNDLLKVDVVLLIDSIFKRANIKHFTVNELMREIKDNQKVWDIYAKGYTVGINQCEKPSTTNKAMAYRPSNISELSAFIAAIRPAFKSMYKKFSSREHFSYGIKAFDKILQTPEFPQSYILYQEQTMNTLNYAGFPIDECYSIIKAIAKKHPEKVRPLKTRFIDGFKKRIIEEDKVSENEAIEMSDKVWQIISDSCGYGFNCVSGETIIKKSGTNTKFIPTIAEMYSIMNDKEYAKKTGHKSLYKKYKKNGYGYALSMYDDNRIRENKIIGIYKSGIRQTYKLTTETGKTIICTDNHKFPTINGKKELKDLSIGDNLYCLGEYEKSNYNATLTNNIFEKNYPQKGECGFRKKENGASVIYDGFRNYNIENKSCCEICKKEFEGKFEVHHKNLDRRNNSLDNFQWLCVSCHKKQHYKFGRTKKFEKGIPTYFDKIISIVPHKIEEVYDVEMQTPAHTFVIDNGLVTSNSAHAYCMALDSLYCAYLKAYYPYEFYEVLMQRYSDKGNKDKVSILKQEMFRAFGIQEGKYKWGADNRKFVADKNNGVIYPSLLSIKGLSQKCSDDLYKLSQKNTYNNFYELFKDIKQIKSLNISKIQTLIQIGYFDEFATIGKIEKFVKCVEDLYERSQFSKENIDEKYMNYIIKYSESTEKQYRNFDFEKALIDIWNDIEDKDISLKERLKYELDNLGYVKTIVSNLNPEYAFVQEYECKFKNPKITLYRLCNGESEIVKVKRKQYDENPMNVGDIIKTIESSNEGRWFNEGKDEDNKDIWRQDKNDKETILKKWTFVR